MKFATLVWYEIRTQRNLWIAAGAAALFSLVSPFIIRVPGYTAAEIRLAAGGIIAFLLAFFSAIFLGAGAMARDLSEQRMSFYFTRPVSVTALWMAKIVGSLATYLGIGLLVPLPAVLVSAGPLDRLGALFAEDTSILYLAAFFVAAFFVAHLFSMALRARTALLGLDLLLWLVSLFVLLNTGRRLLLAEFATALKWNLHILGGAFFLAALASGYIALARGRIDLRRAYIHQLVTFWLILATAVAGTTVYAHWLLHPSFDDLREIDHVMTSPGGTWLLVTGSLRGRYNARATFLWNPAENRIFLNPLDSGDSDFVFAPDDSVILRFNEVRFLRGYSASMSRVDLSGPRITLKELMPLHPGNVGGLKAFLSTAMPGGRLLAIWRYNRLAVYRLDDMSLRAIRRIPRESLYLTDIKFIEPQKMRIFGETSRWAWDDKIPEWVVYDFDLNRKKWDRICRMESPLGKGSGIVGWISPDLHRAILASRSETRRRLDLVDVDQCTVIRTLLESTRADRMKAWSPGGIILFLPDGRLLVYIENAANKLVEIYNPDGRLLNTFPLEFSETAYPNCWFDRTRVAMYLTTREDRPKRILAILDLRTGQLHRTKYSGWPAWTTDRSDRCIRLKEPASGYVFYLHDRIDLLDLSNLSITNLYRVHTNP